MMVSTSKTVDGTAESFKQAMKDIENQLLPFCRKKPHLILIQIKELYPEKDSSTINEGLL